MKDINHKVLIIGIGNIGRSDDGLAWALLDRLKLLVDINTTIHYTYQLNIEHAEKMVGYDRVIMVDAYSGELENGFLWEECRERNNYEYTSHALEPEVINALARQLYSTDPEVYVLKIQGFNWELKEGISKNAKINLERAYNYLLDEQLLKSRRHELQM